MSPYPNFVNFSKRNLCHSSSLESWNTHSTSWHNMIYEMFWNMWCVARSNVFYYNVWKNNLSKHWETCSIFPNLHHVIDWISANNENTLMTTHWSYKKNNDLELSKFKVTTRIRWFTKLLLCLKNWATNNFRYFFRRHLLGYPTNYNNTKN